MSGSARRIATLTAAVATAALIAVPAASAAPGAKLRVTKIGDFPATVAAGESFELSGKVRNSGKADSAAELTASLVGGPEIGSDRIGNVDAKDTKAFSFEATVPAGTSPGVHEVRVCVPRKGTSGKPRCRTRGGLVVPGPGQPPQFTPGARSAGDTLFPQIGNGGYDALHYGIDLDYDPVANTFAPGTSTTMSARAAQNLSQFSLDFQSQLEVSSVTVNGQAAQFGFAPTDPLGDPSVVTQLTKLVVTPAAGIPSGSEFTVVVDYAGTPVRITDADESFEGWIPACFGPGQTAPCDGGFVVNEPNGAQGWFPSNNYPTDKATFDTTITVPNTHVAWGIGELESRTPTGAADWTWHWREDDPTPTYLTTATVGLFDYSVRTILEASTGRALPGYFGIDSSFTDPQKVGVNAIFDETESMLSFLSDHYGPYPLDSIGGVQDRTVGVGYALEVQTKPHYASLGSNSLSTHLHEIAHMWFGNTVTLEQWTDIWFQEGFAQWSEWIWAFETQGGPDPAQNFDDLYANMAAEDWEVAPAVLDGDPSLLFFTPAVYDRGSMVIQATREILGDDGFETLVDGLMTDFRYGNISTQEFIDLVVEISGFDGADLDELLEFYDQWLYGEEKPTLLPEDVGSAPAPAPVTGSSAGSAPARSPGLR